MGNTLADYQRTLTQDYWASTRDEERYGDGVISRYMVLSRKASEKGHYWFVCNIVSLIGLRAAITLSSERRSKLVKGVLSQHGLKVSTLHRSRFADKRKVCVAPGILLTTPRFLESVSVSWQWDLE